MKDYNPKSLEKLIHNAASHEQLSIALQKAIIQNNISFSCRPDNILIEQIIPAMFLMPLQRAIQLGYHLRLIQPSDLISTINSTQFNIHNESMKTPISADMFCLHLMHTSQFIILLQHFKAGEVPCIKSFSHSLEQLGQTPWVIDLAQQTKTPDSLEIMCKLLMILADRAILEQGPILSQLCRSLLEATKKCSNFSNFYKTFNIANKFIMEKKPVDIESKHQQSYSTVRQATLRTFLSYINDHRDAIEVSGSNIYTKAWLKQRLSLIQASLIDIQSCAQQSEASALIYKVSEQLTLDAMDMCKLKYHMKEIYTLQTMIKLWPTLLSAQFYSAAHIAEHLGLLSEAQLMGLEANADSNTMSTLYFYLSFNWAYTIFYRNQFQTAYPFLTEPTFCHHFIDTLVDGHAVYWLSQIIYHELISQIEDPLYTKQLIQFTQIIIDRLLTRGLDDDQTELMILSCKLFSGYSEYSVTQSINAYPCFQSKSKTEKKHLSRKVKKSISAISLNASQAAEQIEAYFQDTETHHTALPNNSIHPTIIVDSSKAVTTTAILPLITRFTTQNRTLESSRNEASLFVFEHTELAAQLTKVPVKAVFSTHTALDDKRTICSAYHYLKTLAHQLAESHTVLNLNLSKTLMKKLQTVLAHGTQSISDYNYILKSIRPIEVFHFSSTHNFKNVTEQTISDLIEDKPFSDHWFVATQTIYIIYQLNHQLIKLIQIPKIGKYISQMMGDYLSPTQISAFYGSLEQQQSPIGSYEYAMLLQKMFQHYNHLIRDHKSIETVFNRRQTLHCLVDQLSSCQSKLTAWTTVISMLKISFIHFPAELKLIALNGIMIYTNRFVDHAKPSCSLDRDPLVNDILAENTIDKPPIESLSQTVLNFCNLCASSYDYLALRDYIWKRLATLLHFDCHSLPDQDKQLIRSALLTYSAKFIQAPEEHYITSQAALSQLTIEEDEPATNTT